MAIACITLVRLGRHFPVFCQNWNDALFEEAELASRLTTEAQKKPQPELHLRADKTTSYQRLATVMSVAQNAGIEKLGFITEPNPDE